MTSRPSSGKWCLEIHHRACKLGISWNGGGGKEFRGERIVRSYFQLLFTSVATNQFLCWYKEDKRGLSLVNNQVSILEREFFSFREKFLRDRLSCAKGIGYCLKCMRGFFTNLGGGCEKSEAGDFLLLLTVENLTCSVLPICIGPPVLNVSQKKTAPARSQKHGTSPSECTKRTLHPRSSPPPPRLPIWHTVKHCVRIASLDRPSFLRNF